MSRMPRSAADGSHHGIRGSFHDEPQPLGGGITQSLIEFACPSTLLAAPIHGSANSLNVDATSLQRTYILSRSFLAHSPSSIGGTEVTNDIQYEKHYGISSHNCTLYLSADQPLPHGMTVQAPPIPTRQNGLLASVSLSPSHDAMTQTQQPTH